MHGSTYRRVAGVLGGALLIVALLPASAAGTVAGPPYQLVFSQPPTNTAAGSPITPTVTVTIEDSAGTTVPTSSTLVSIGITAGSPAGGLHGSVAVTATNGVATLH